MRMLTLFAILLAAFPATTLGQDAPFVVLSEREEIDLARSAAPPAISAQARIWILRDGRYIPAGGGSSENACMVARTYENSLEPICFGPEAARTVMRIDQRRVELRLEGRSRAEIDGIIESEIGAGALKVPQRPTVAYMMSPGQHLFSSDGRDAGNWKPHMHVFMPYLTPEEMGLSEFTPNLMVDRAGKPNASAIIVLPEFTDPE